MTWKSCDFLNQLLLTRSSLQDTVDKAMSVFLYKSMLIGQEILSVSVKWGSTVRPHSTMRSQPSLPCRQEGMAKINYVLSLFL